MTDLKYIITADRKYKVSNFSQYNFQELYFSHRTEDNNYFCTKNPFKFFHPYFARKYIQDYLKDKCGNINNFRIKIYYD